MFELFVKPITNKIQAAYVVKTSKSGIRTAAYTADFYKTMNCDEFEVDSVLHRRVSAEDDSSRLQKENSKYNWEQFVKLPTEDEMLDDSFDHAAKGMEWGEKLVQGLNDTKWQYSNGPFVYGGLCVEDGTEAPWDTVFLNEDIAGIAREMFGEGEEKDLSTLDDGIIESIFSNTASNDPEKILSAPSPVPEN